MSTSDEGNATQPNRRSLALMGNKNGAKPYIVEHQKHGCIVPVSHYRSPKGYATKRYIVDGKSCMRSVHREELRRFLGIDQFPPDTDVDHLCDNRGCIALDHLQMLERSEHMRKTRLDEQSFLEANARMFWLLTNCNAQDLRTAFRIRLKKARGWVEEWQKAAAQRIAEEGAETYPVS